ncbi:TRHR [Lepeophtheirus salmonis]|uniref:TRHR n=1 Tax=Lepeophtheirus salmonis TaxID=72036 RepID=A0A7R8CG24_LEPSM|nr:TRHR [Lepeophtheirus salmonis]CAF2771598.1 TRHR [Lepeophtheirus salmonis]
MSEQQHQRLLIASSGFILNKNNRNSRNYQNDYPECLRTDKKPDVGFRGDDCDGCRRRLGMRLLYRVPGGCNGDDNFNCCGPSPLLYDGECFKYVVSKFPKLSTEKIKAGVFDAPKIRKLMRNEEIAHKMTNKEKNASWFSFKDVVDNCLANCKAANYKELVKRMMEDSKVIRSTYIYVCNSNHCDELVIKGLAVALPGIKYIMGVSISKNPTESRNLLTGEIILERVLKFCRTSELMASRREDFIRPTYYIYKPTYIFNIRNKMNGIISISPHTEAVELNQIGQESISPSSRPTNPLHKGGFLLCACSCESRRKRTAYNNFFITQKSWLFFLQAVVVWMVVCLPGNIFTFILYRDVANKGDRTFISNNNSSSVGSMNENSYSALRINCGNNTNPREWVLCTLHLLQNMSIPYPSPICYSGTFNGSACYEELINMREIVLGEDNYHYIVSLETPEAQDKEYLCHETHEVSSFYLKFSTFWLEGVCILIVGGFGLIGNIMTLVVLGRIDSNTTYNKLLMTLAIVDFLLIFYYFFGLWSYWYLYSLSKETRTTVVSSGLSLLFYTLLDKRAICYPLTHRPAFWPYFLLVLSISGFQNIPKLFEFELDFNITTNISDYNTTPLNEDQRYITFSSWWDELIITGIIPFSALVVFNSLRSDGVRMQSLRKKYVHQNGENSVVAMSSDEVEEEEENTLLRARKLVKQAYEVTHPSHSTPEHHAYCENEGRIHVPVAFYVMLSASNLLLVVNSSMNFIIYCCVGRTFREELKNIVSGIFRKRYMYNK